MSSISALNGSTAGATGIATSGRPFGRPGGGALDTAATALGLSRDDVISALRQGDSLDDLAQKQGVSHDDLVAALKKDMPAELASGGKADEIAERIASQKGLPGRRQRPEQGPPPPPPPSSDSSTGVLGTSLTTSQQTTLSKLSDLLGIDSDNLLTQLRNGTSLSDLTAAAGVTSASLASILQDGLLVDTTV